MKVSENNLASFRLETILLEFLVVYANSLIYKQELCLREQANKHTYSKPVKVSYMCKQASVCVPPVGLNVHSSENLCADAI